MSSLFFGAMSGVGTIGREATRNPTYQERLENPKKKSFSDSNVLLFCGDGTKKLTDGIWKGQ